MKIKEPVQSITPPIAEAVFREVAMKFKANKALKRFGNFKPKHIANARASYASTMTDDELPLAMVDTSFLQNGKAGMLLTNRRLYSSVYGNPIDLQKVFAATVDAPTELQSFVGAKTAKSLLINGLAVHRATGSGVENINFEFWTTLILELAKTSRGLQRVTTPANCQECETQTRAHTVAKHTASATVPIDVTDADNRTDYPRLAAASICSGESEFTIVTNLVKCGMAEARAQQMVQMMLRIYQRPRRATAFLVLAAGLAITLFSVIATSTTEYIFYGAFLFGLPISIIGFYRVVCGSPPPSTDDLIRVWQKQQ